VSPHAHEIAQPVEKTPPRKKPTWTLSEAETKGLVLSRIEKRGEKMPTFSGPINLSTARSELEYARRVKSNSDPRYALSTLTSTVSHLDGALSGIQSQVPPAEFKKVRDLVREASDQLSHRHVNGSLKKTEDAFVGAERLYAAYADAPPNVQARTAMNAAIVNAARAMIVGSTPETEAEIRQALALQGLSL
jgi:hypothetical protein